MKRKLTAAVLIITLMVSFLTPTVFASDGSSEKLENAINVVTSSVSEAEKIFPDQQTVSTYTSIFKDFISVAGYAGTVFGAVNGSITFLKLIGLIKDSNADAMANIQTQLQIINEQLAMTETQLNNITTQMSQIQASAEFNSRTSKAIILQNSWNDFEYRYVEEGMDNLMTQYNGMLLNGMQNWCLNKTEDARTKDGIDNSKVVLHYAFTDGEYKIMYSSVDEDPSDFDASDRYLVLSSDYLPQSLSWNVNTYRSTIESFISDKIRSTDDFTAFEYGNFPTFTEEGKSALTEEIISQVAEDAVNVLLYRVAAAEVNKDSTFSLQVERQFINYCKHLLAPEDGMDAMFQVFYLTHAFEYQIADALTLFCNEMAIKTGVYGSFAANVLGMSSFITDQQKSTMLDSYCDTLIAIGAMKGNCLTGKDRYCYLTNTELYLGEISFTNKLSINTRHRGMINAYESCSTSPAETDYIGDWTNASNMTLLGDANTLLLMYMLQSNGEATDFDHLKEALRSTAYDYGAIVTSTGGETALPLNSPLSMSVTNVVGNYFKNVSTTSLRSLPSGAETDYIKYRSMITGSVINASGALEVNKILDATCIYGENHWYWEVDEAAFLGGADYPGKVSTSSNKVQTALDFPGTYYYRTDYTQSVSYNCLVSIPLRLLISTGDYSPLFSYSETCAEIADSIREDEDTDVIEFADVAEGAYYYDAVYWAAGKGITDGTDETHFSPDADCTRAQLVTFLWRAAGEPEPDDNICEFTDVDLSAYYGKALLWAVENGITNGVTETAFLPDGTVTRAQAVTFIYRFAYIDLPEATLPFDDVTTDLYYYDAVVWAYRKNIVDGTTDSTFSPDDNCTRAQAVTLLYRLINK